MIPAMDVTLTTNTWKSRLGKSQVGCRVKKRPKIHTSNRKGMEGNETTGQLLSHSLCLLLRRGNTRGYESATTRALLPLSTAQTNERDVTEPRYQAYKVIVNAQQKPEEQLLPPRTIVMERLMGRYMPKAMARIGMRCDGSVLPREILLKVSKLK